MANDRLSKQQLNGHGASPGESEYSWGRGRTPQGLENDPPNRGGVYRGISPPSEDATRAAIQSVADLIAGEGA